MKSKSKVFLVIALGILFLSCSNLFQAKGKGSVSIQLPQANLLVSEQKLAINKEKIMFILEISDGMEFSLQKEALSGENIEFELEAGNYSINAIAYDSDDVEKIFPLYKGTAKFAVAGGEKSNVYLIMKRIPAAEFVKNDLDKQSGLYNYTWGGDIVKYYSDFNKVLKNGDCLTVTFKGIANTAFKGTFDAAIGKGGRSNAWTAIAKDSKYVDFNVGDKVTVSFDFLVDTNAKDKNDTQFNIFYEKDAYDDVMAFNEYTIDFNLKPSFNAIEHNIHIGNRIYNIFTRSGYAFDLPKAEELNLLTNNNYKSFTLNGYYTNSSFTGSTVTAITAEENTKAMDFYLKPTLNLSKNNNGSVAEGGNSYDYRGDFRINYFAKGSNEILFRELPKSGETLYFTFEGLAGKDFDGDLSCELIEDSAGWTVFDAQTAQLQVRQGEKFTLYYELTVPADKSLVSFDHSAFNFFYKPEVLDEELSISDIKVTLYGGKYGNDYKPLMIDISVVLPEYKTGNIAISQSNSDHGIEFACDDSELTRKGIELTSYKWILSCMDTDQLLSTEKSFVLTNEDKAKLEYNGLYALSLVAHDADNNMYAETAYLTLANENGKPMHNIQNGPVLEVTLPSDYSQGKLKIEQSATENNGTKFTVLNLPEEYEYCMWTFEDEVVSRTASYELTGEEKAKLEQKKYVLSFFVKEKDGTYYDAEIYINIIK